jgi:hypothetical protein
MPLKPLSHVGIITCLISSLLDVILDMLSSSRGQLFTNLTDAQILTIKYRPRSEHIVQQERAAEESIF